MGFWCLMGDEQPIKPLCQLHSSPPFLLERQTRFHREKENRGKDLHPLIHFQIAAVARDRLESWSLQSENLAFESSCQGPIHMINKDCQYEQHTMAERTVCNFLVKSKRTLLRQKVTFMWDVGTLRLAMGRHLWGGTEAFGQQPAPAWLSLEWESWAPDEPSDDCRSNTVQLGRQVFPGPKFRNVYFYCLKSLG